MTDEEVIKSPCESCGGEVETVFIGYSCPLAITVKCKACGRKIDRTGAEGIKVVEMSESRFQEQHSREASMAVEMLKVYSRFGPGYFMVPAAIVSTLKVGKYIVEENGVYLWDTTLVGGSMRWKVEKEGDPVNYQPFTTIQQGGKTFSVPACAFKYLFEIGAVSKQEEQ